jgi:hypothetical protein
MPIDDADLHTRLVEVPEEIAVREIREMLTMLPVGAHRHWYVVARLAAPSRHVVPRLEGGYEAVEAPPPGYAVVLPVKELSEQWSRDGEVLLDMALCDVPGLLLPAVTIERQTMGTGRARREWMPVSPRRRLVVLEQGQVLGLLTDEERAGGFSGFMATLFGRERKRVAIAKGRITYRCPVDGGRYDFAELIDLATNRLVCPQGHLIEE